MSIENLGLEPSDTKASGHIHLQVTVPQPVISIACYPGVPLIQSRNRMRMTKEQRRAAAQPLSYEHNSETIPDVRSKLPDHLSHRGEILFPNGRMLVQRPLPPRVGHVGFDSYTTADIDPETPVGNQDRLPDVGTIFDIERTPPISPSKHRKKRAAQWRRWDQEIIPLLIPHYSWVVWETKCLRELEKLGPPVQDCDCIPRIQRVTIMRFSSVEDMDVPVCECRLAAVTLIKPTVEHTPADDSVRLDMVRAPAGPVQSPLPRGAEKMRSVPPAPVVARDESPDSSPHRRASPARPSTPVTPRPPPLAQPKSQSRTPHLGSAREPTPGGPATDDTIPLGTVDLIVCLDACFTQKRKTSASDPSRRHPCSHFVPEADAKATDAYVNETRGTFGPAEPRSKKSKTKTTSAAEETEDGYDHLDLLLPRSVLDACEASFKAADEKRVKASTDFFEDTGLMALLCRHDRVLWLVNMQTRGEQQYYVIVLLETLFQHLPQDITVGILYDIACTLERSCRKWGFLSRFMHRSETAFGLSDSEGCERFWHAISHLIAVLRISGKWQRLYVLDAQIEHADELSLQRLGDWLRRRSLQQPEKCQEAESALSRRPNPFPTDYVNRLRAKFLGAAEDADEEADYHQVEFDKADACPSYGPRRPYERRACPTSNTIMLGMNARATKAAAARSAAPTQIRIRSRRAVVSMTGEWPAVKRREKGIQHLAFEYNKQCAKVAQLIRDKNAPRGMLAPRPIPDGELWKLDVDDEIWENVWPRRRRNRAADHPTTVVVIKAVLQIDRSHEEDIRLKKERAASPSLVSLKRWALVNSALNEADTAPDRYQYELMRDDLIYQHSPPWGPNATQLARARLDTRRAARGEDRHYNADQAEFSDEEEEWESGGENEGL
ncbi:hypothetical protein B0H14DRAFT_2617038 [Mycena olivaceomarginata]|nr:hypothetical protein B0H14DRAFT_2617038 [Mycena olivaceomarginata]